MNKYWSKLGKSIEDATIFGKINYDGTVKDISYYEMRRRNGVANFLSISIDSKFVEERVWGQSDKLAGQVNC